MTFTTDTFAFLNDLAANNSKDWFEANRDRYEAYWKSPAFDVIEALANFMASTKPKLKAEARINGSLRRINRDVRFSKDQSPYSASLHLVFWHGSHPNRSPGMHFVLRPEGVGFGAGQWAIEPERLAQLRSSIVNSPAKLQDALSKANDAGCQLGAPDLARLPKGFEAEGEAARLLRYKGFVARTQDSRANPKAILGEEGLDWMRTRTEACLPLLHWLSA